MPPERSHFILIIKIKMAIQFNWLRIILATPFLEGEQSMDSAYPWCSPDIKIMHLRLVSFTLEADKVQRGAPKSPFSQFHRKYLTSGSNLWLESAGRCNSPESSLSPLSNDINNVHVLQVLPESFHCI